jgi:hypothetical protein
VGDSLSNWVDLRDPTPLTEVALRLVARSENGELDPAGTAVMFGELIALTAKHTIEDYLQKLQRRPARLGDRDHHDTKIEIALLKTLRDGKTQIVYQVEKIWVSRGSDLAVMKLLPQPQHLPPKGYRPTLPIFDLFPPQAGEAIFGVGFHSGTASEGDKIIKVNHEAHLTRGKVIEVHDQQRDNFLLNFPCFQVDARFDGGMSGGPVFNARGHVCGIICSCAPTNDGYLSYATTLWPLMCLAIEIPRPGKPSGSYPVADLADANLVHVVGRERITILGEGDAFGCKVNRPGNPG